MSSRATFLTIIEDYKKKIEYFSTNAKHHESQAQFHANQAEQCRTELKVLRDELDSLMKMYDRQVGDSEMELDEPLGSVVETTHLN
tara:strand:+ start:43 stop:300 length:258 start_codon:yes stop_codon:yes gene_type:complete